MTKKLPILGSIVALMTKVLGHTFLAASWKAWRTLLRGAFEGLQALDDGGRELIFKLTGRRRMPASLRELWVICGRRAGKSIIAAVLAICATTCRKYTLAPGEVGTCAIVAVDRKQARVIKRYISGLMRSVPSRLLN